jgi:hypothetical protein
MLTYVVSIILMALSLLKLLDSPVSPVLMAPNFKIQKTGAKAVCNA